MAKTLEVARRDAWAYNAGLRQSSLASFCQKKIFPFIADYQREKRQQLHEVAKLQVAVDRRRAQADRVASLTSLMKECKAAKNDDVKKACTAVLRSHALGTSMDP